jgi:hypothetical protein
MTKERGVQRGRRVVLGVTKSGTQNDKRGELRMTREGRSE